ncbi:MAG: RIO1 family regulatory kinase/ATPase, partial [Mycobacteriales bacterium]
GMSMPPLAPGGNRLSLAVEERQPHTASVMTGADVGELPEFELIPRKVFSLAEHAEHALAHVSGDTSGPNPPPEWLITDLAALDEDLGVLKTGKEAVVSLVERHCGQRSHLLARKDYREVTQRAFRQDTTYRAGRSRRRGDQALFEAGGRRGLLLRAAEWRQREFAVLSDLWLAGVAVPYPVCMTGQSVLMQYLGEEAAAAPRLVDARLGRTELAELWDQAVNAMRGIFETGYVHGDLSPYNLLVWEGLLWVIDLPQAVTVSQAENWRALLERDISNVSGWFAKHGIAVDADVVWDAITGGVR